MDKYDKISSTASKKDTYVTDNAHKIDTILYETEVDNTVKEIKSQLLSLDGWQNFQKELIQLCFEFWEVNETQVQVNNSLQSDLKISDSEMLIPSSLFADRKNIDCKSKAYGFNDFPKEFQNRDGSEANDNVFKSQYEAGPAVVNRRFSKVNNNNVNLKTIENCSKSFEIRGNKRAQNKKSKKFSFYKHMSNQGKLKTKLQSINFEMLNTVEKIKKHCPSIDTTRCDNIEEHVDEIENNNNTCAAAVAYSIADVEENQMEQKVRKLIKSLKNKDKLFTSIDANEQTTKFGSSNKLKYFFKNAFRGSQDELDLQLLDDYTKYINNKVHTWQKLLHCLEDIRQKDGCKIKTDLSEDTIERCKLRNDHGKFKKAKDDYDDNCSKFVEFSDGGFNGTGKQKKKKFFNLLNKTIKRRGLQSNADDVQAVNLRRQSSNRFDSDVKDETDATLSRDRYRKCAELQIRKSLSETDLSAMMLYYDETKSAVVKNGMMQFDGKTQSFTSNRLSVVEDEYDYFQWDDKTCRRLWEERQECFQTAVARLEYVGSTLKEQCELAGLKTLCKVDVLAGFGHTAEAVDLFVSILPMSNNPGLMIRKAEAAYDWKFFCHLSMWRYSYKD